MYAKSEIIKNIYDPNTGTIRLDQVSCLDNENNILKFFWIFLWWTNLPENRKLFLYWLKEHDGLKYDHTCHSIGLREIWQFMLHMYIEHTIPVKVQTQKLKVDLNYSEYMHLGHNSNKDSYDIQLKLWI